MTGLSERALFSDRLSLWVFVSYGVFLLGFFFFPDRPLHYKFYYAAVLLPGLFMAYRELPLLWKNGLFKLLLVWLSYQLLSGLWSDNLTRADFSTLAGWWVQVVTFIIVTASLVRRYPEEFDFLMRVLVAGIALLAVVSIFSWYATRPFPMSRLEPIGRIDNAILAGCAYGAFALLALHFAVVSRVLPVRVLYGAAFLVLAAAILLTHSRTAMLGLLAAFIAMPFCFGRRAALAMLVLLSMIMVVALSAFPGVFDRFYMDLHWRPLIWENVLAHIAEAPWFGHGYLSDTTVPVGRRMFQHAHSSYLGFLRDGGIAGAAIFLVMVAGFFRHIIRYGCKRAKYIVPLLVFAFVVIAPDIDRLIVRPKELWLFFWFPLALFVGISQQEAVRDETSDS
ncbi:O-antigen ligase [Thiogranum longum]|uniref:O-antigen ligase n=1 Tax=Thiogranum longum TaxID=1537524 RepID=A0A4R1HFR3_9GAMM|nr:O-antigen ligase family protein [Thiogranum longum]TCK19080.1 O-antigen ligase [Thiogranum longum]